MTISGYIIDFLKLYNNIKIDTNHIEAGADKNGLFKSPARDLVRTIDGSTIVTEYYNFFAFANSMSEAERIEDDEWLEKFIYWIDDFPIMYKYPPIDGRRNITDIDVNGCPTPYTDDNNGIMYQISLKITYEREVS